MARTKPYEASRVETRRPAAACGALLTVLALLGAVPATPAELVSVGTSGVSANHRSGSTGVTPPGRRISADGRHVVFESFASNLASADQNGSTQDVFVRDRLTGAVTLVSVAADGGPANDDSFDPVISADGRYVAFVSKATNLVPGPDPNSTADIFRRDLLAGTTTLVSASASGEYANFVSHGPAISGDGRIVAFYSSASNLVPGDTRDRWDVFARDMVAGTVERVSVTTAGEEGFCCDAVNPSITADGRYVLFLTQSQLDPPVFNQTQEMFLRDRVAGTTTIVMPAGDGTLSTTGIRFAEISADGRFVAYQSNSNDIVLPDANGFVHDVFRKDLVTGTVTLVSQGTDGTQGNFDSWMPSLSADGRFVAFHSWANNLVPGDTNIHPFYDIFVRDTQAGTTTRVNLTPNAGESDGTAQSASISADGTLVYFESTGTDLVAGDANGVQDVFLAGPSFLPANQPPGAVDDAVATPEDTAVGVDVRLNDSDADGDPLTVVSFTQGVHGAVTQDGDLLVYTPEANFAGTDSFQYTLADGKGGSDAASVAVTVAPVNDAPVAVDDQYRTTTAPALSVGAATGVLANDADPDGDALRAVLVAAPAQGALSLGEDGSFTYVPQEGSNGAVTFTYRAVDPAAAASAVTTVTIVVQVGEVPVSTCRPVIPAAVHRVKTTGADFMGEPFLGNRRLAHIEDGTVPCVEVDTLEVTRCAFWTSSDSREVRVARRDSGPWLEDVEGRRWAVVGQPVTRDGSLGHGAFIVGTTPDADGAAPCVVSSGHDSAGVMSGTDLGATCVEEVAGSETNASGLRLRNYTTRFVGTTSVPHPDALGEPVSFDPITGVAWYTGEGAAVNDLHGERDPNGIYYGQDWSCHLIVSNGVQVPAAKRPSTVSFPKPGRVNVHSRIRWQTMNPYVEIANDTPVDPRIGSGPEARFTHVVAADTLSLDGSPSNGDILLYTWDLEWTPKNPDAFSGSATTVIPLSLEAGPWSGMVRLTVTARDGQKHSFRKTVVLRAAPVAAFTAGVTLNTLYVDASTSQGDIVQYTWELEWTAQAPDLVSAVPTAEFPVAFQGIPPRTGLVTLTVTARDGQAHTTKQRVTFRVRHPFPAANVAPAN